MNSVLKVLNFSVRIKVNYLFYLKGMYILQSKPIYISLLVRTLDMNSTIINTFGTYWIEYWISISNWANMGEVQLRTNQIRVQGKYNGCAEVGPIHFLFRNQKWLIIQRNIMSTVGLFPLTCPAMYSCSSSPYYPLSTSPATFSSVDSFSQTRIWESRC